jgi:hypothetical protein
MGNSLTSPRGDAIAPMPVAMPNAHLGRTHGIQALCKIPAERALWLAIDANKSTGLPFNGLVQAELTVHGCKYNGSLTESMTKHNTEHKSTTHGSKFT